jgi:hypothetical protein
MYQQLRQVEFMLKGFWRNIDLQELETAARKSLEAVRRQVQLAQAVAKDYEFVESEEDTRAQVRLLPKLVKALEQLRTGILKSSEYDLVGAVDVAQLTSQLDELIDRLR